MFSEEMLSELTKEKDSTIIIRIPKKLKNICSKTAKENKMDLSKFTRVALIKYLGELKI